MSMFVCIACDQYADSDDGCVEAPPNFANKQHHGLICETCISNGVLEDEDGPQHSSEHIYSTLVAAGCPEDIAAELAREKGKEGVGT